ncbi:MAG: hydrogenase maturation nickel metallochaperone HypA [Chlorobiaceae bacterium]|jgi:hydrogenase nickel incorporation protein HypA/HybF|nr:hydrogenase maturation nickel metallochaperone HypA [Chlorobiaceae bacterium]
MHEMSIALSVIDAVVARALGEGCSRVTGIELVVGRLSGVAVDSLTFCFSAAARGTPAEEAELVIDEREGQGRCEACSAVFPVSTLYAKCPTCGQFRVQIESGEELLVKSITIE